MKHLLLNFILFSFLLIQDIYSYPRSNKILMKDIQVLTLHQGRLTKSRNVRPIQQIECIGGTAKCSYEPPNNSML
ncbi:hypothetical protein M0811_03699 [Anaeramoeba ignava]|uniref:Store-operated calcium entry-associated regulatory factor n=1 Tax=Anaeramoeba ignava TaxID=1746090 RepID=A0A9Q0LWV9_ANAIG|nr:hypothetical protein M0811_03699 [Anaeramoeba ignava]